MLVKAYQHHRTCVRFSRRKTKIFFQNRGRTAESANEFTIEKNVEYVVCIEISIQ
jgi:hypothetical protein